MVTVKMMTFAMMIMTGWEARIGSDEDDDRLDDDVDFSWW